MKQLFLLTISYCMALQGYTQNLTLTFNPKLHGTSVDSIVAYNLKTGASTKFIDNVINLKDITLSIPLYSERYKTQIFPNPYFNSATIQFSSASSTKAIVNVTDITGKIMTSIQQEVQQGEHSFSLIGGSQGLYYIQIIAAGLIYTSPVICNKTSRSGFTLQYMGGKETSATKEKSAPTLKNTSRPSNTMNYTPGDNFIFKCLSGTYATVVADTPGKDSTYKVGLYTCADADGNNYETVTINAKVWMAENLKTTRYNDDKPIPNVTVQADWGALTTWAYCWYSNNEAYFKPIYGALYNWYAVNTGKLCPTGWHVPADAEWTSLTDFLGGLTVAGGKLKETGTTHWTNPNTGADNSSGFTALPGGYRSTLSFSNNGFSGWYWSSTEYSGTIAWYLNLGYKRNDVSIEQSVKTGGYSVRCVKD